VFLDLLEQYNMNISGHAFLALWNDVNAEADVEYNRWHTNEHVPERVGITGFISGRRYVSSAQGQHRYFTLYEVDAPEVFDSAAYRDVIAHPTAWSTAMRPQLRNVVRATCATIAATGDNPGQAIASVRFSGSHVEAQELTDACRRLSGVTSVLLGRVTRSVPDAFKTWSSAAPSTHVLLVEASEEATLISHGGVLNKLMHRYGGVTGPVFVDTYALAFGITHSQVDASLIRPAAANDTRR
jgi:hypothetical protein